MTNLFFTSDLHFGHKNILKFNPGTRAFSDTEEMDEHIIQHWNDTIRPKDTVYHLGDFSFLNNTKTVEIMNRLQGNIVWIKGNHDNQKVFKDMKTYDIKQINADKQKIVLCHFPIACWNGSGRGYWHLHGHSHGSYKTQGKILDVGWDNIGKIVSFEEVRAYMNEQPVITPDHH